MAKYVIAGKSDCPFYAKAELLADELQARLIDFKVNKIVVEAEDWNGWVQKICAERKWAYSGESPLIWKELIDRGGKGILLGSCNDFLEMVNGYYGIKSVKMTDELLKIAEENKATKIKDDGIEKARKDKSNPLKVCISSAANDVCYQILVAICNWKIFPSAEEVSICLLDEKENHELLDGYCMELTDSAPGQLKEVYSTNNPEEAFKNAKLIIILDGIIMEKDTMNIEDYNHSVKEIDFSPFQQYGELIGKSADEDAKVIVAGGPSNLICNILISANAKGANNDNFFALSRLQENRAKSIIAGRLNVKTADIQSVIIWGQSHYNQLIDVSLSRVVGYDGAVWGPHIPGYSQDTKEMVHDQKWLAKELAEKAIQKGVDLRNARENSSSISYAAAILDQLFTLYNGLKSDEIYSIGIVSKGWFGVPEGLVFSFPVKFQKGQLEVLSYLEVDEEMLAKIKEIATTLRSNVHDVLAGLGLDM
eukprot:Seg404.11 transcript_id=Seg404.11/GoldUCD/mRNA.D3Y31 product="putative malate dehydrogenase 1B" protein_id=Seg404.11/GoldUCD/D3Y31